MSLFRTIKIAAWTALGVQVVVALVFSAFGKHYSDYSGSARTAMITAMFTTLGICFGLAVAQMLVTGEAYGKYGSTYTRSDQPISYWIMVLGDMVGVLACLVGIWSFVLHRPGQ
jgi:hypothetical protein